ncbi:MAG: response regulator [Chloroflexia bacterium]
MTDQGATILVADDDPRILQLLRAFLESLGYRALLTQTGNDAVQVAQENVPDLVILDVMMPQMDGFEVCRQLRNDTRTSHVPILMLTSRITLEAKLTGFESGADDYMTKPFELAELRARVRALLRRSREMQVRSPLTGLPGNRLLLEELRHRIQRRQPFALLFVDIDYFKAFNDAYGFLRGDKAIQLLGRLIEETVAEVGAPGDFVGHIGGDDFAVITDPKRAEEICRSLIKRFDASVGELYDPADRERGYLRGYDRHGVPHRFPLMTISIGVVTSVEREFADPDEVSRIATEMKEYAKRFPGSNYAVDQRGRKAPRLVTPERRGRRPSAAIAVCGSERDLLELIQLEVEKNGHTAVLFSRGEELLAACRTSVPGLVVLDASQQGMSVWALCRELRTLSGLEHRPILLLSTDPEDEERAFEAQVDAFLLKPFSLKRLLACVDDLLERSPNHHQPNLAE